MISLLPAPFVVLSVILQVLLIIHAYRTGRRDLILMLVVLPGIGSLVYTFLEILPEIRHGDFAANFQRTFLPQQKIRQMRKNLKLTDTITNRLNLAEAYAEQKQYKEAIELAESCLNDPYINHNGILLKLSRLFFLDEQYSRSIELMEKARQDNYGRIDRPEDELLYARALDYTHSNERAQEEYERVIRVHHSMEAMYYYGMFLKKHNRMEEAITQFKKVREEKELHPRYVRHKNAKWIRASRAEARTA